MDLKFSEEPQGVEASPPSVPAADNSQEIEAITFDTANDRIVVRRKSGAVSEYRRDDAAAYLDEHLRPEDLEAMGWNV